MTQLSIFTNVYILSISVYTIMVSRRQQEFYQERRRRRERQLSEASHSYGTRILRGSRRLLKRNSFPYYRNRYRYRLSPGMMIISALFALIIYLISKTEHPNIFLMLFLVVIYLVLVTFDLGRPNASSSGSEK